MKTPARKKGPSWNRATADALVAFEKEMMGAIDNLEDHLYGVGKEAKMSEKIPTWNPPKRGAPPSGGCRGSVVEFVVAVVLVLLIVPVCVATGRLWPGVLLGACAPLYACYALLLNGSSRRG